MLAVTSVYPYFVISALLLAAGWVVSRRSRFYRTLLDAEEAAPRYLAIDGLRGFLALAVFFHHAVISYFFYQSGRWAVPPSRFYTLCGQVAVAFFFMITAFLFWTKGIKAKPFLQVQPYLWSRLARLVPMYLFSVACVVIVALAMTGFSINESAPALVKEVMAWSSFGFIDAGDINGFGQSEIVNSVYWSLRYEWLFYLFLPLGLIFCRGIGFIAFIAVWALLILAFSTRRIEWFFLFGIIAAAAHRQLGRWRELKWDSWPFNLFVAALLVWIFTQFDRGYGIGQAALLFLCFLCIANGSSLFGLLTSRAGRLLGTLSYSIYVMHSIVLYVVLHCVNRIIPLVALEPAIYWLVVAGCSLVVVLICALTYRLVEHPFLGARMPAWLGNGAPIAANRQRTISGGDA